MTSRAIMGARDEEKVRHSLTAGGPRRMGEVMSGRNWPILQLWTLWPCGSEIKP